MTYTFKLSRRLAVSRKPSIVIALTLSLACADDSTAPDSLSLINPSTSSALRVYPTAVTVETNQRVRFRGLGHVPGGKASSSVILSWHATGGTISSDGVFLSATSGTFKVVGRGRGGKHSDSSTVVVVPSQPDLARLEIAPDSVTLAPGATEPFTATGRLSDGSTVTVGVVWSATGGQIDPSGSYTADSVAGHFRVVAANTAGTIADTALVTISRPAAPTPTLAQVVVTPASVALNTGATKQFAAYGRTTAGDSVPVVATYAATGGTISSGGLYTAGLSAGTYRVVATSSGLSDTAVVTLTTPLGATVGAGVPFGPAALWSGNTVQLGPAPFTASTDAITASTIISRLEAARSLKLHVMLNMTGGSHDQYLTNGVFDRAKWEARMNTYNTSAIKQAVAAAVADGTIIGNSVMDEPQVSGGGDGNTWGPPGTMTKARVDSLCGYVKRMFPTLPTGVFHRHTAFQPDKSYRVCEFIISSYATREGSASAFRDDGLALAKRDGHAIAFSINLLNGGTQDKDGTWDCQDQGGQKGLIYPNCRMTAQQVLDYGKVLGPAGCSFFMWRYDATFFSRWDNQAAMRQVSDYLAKLARRPCVRL